MIEKLGRTGELALRAPAKLNLSLFLGGRREDGLHEIRSIFHPLALADRLAVSRAASDEVLCDPIERDELGAHALAALRERGWSSPPLRIEIEKRIPIAAGLGGGSADAAAVLRLGAAELGELTDVAAHLGADVPSQLQPRAALVSGAGERVEPLDPSRELGVLLLPLRAGLETAEVFAEADRLGIPRSADELTAMEARLREASADGFDPFSYPDLAVNDLEPAALSLRPEVGEALDQVRALGAGIAAVTGSGPTVFGLFRSRAGAVGAAGRLEARDPQPIATALAPGLVGEARS